MRRLKAEHGRKSSFWRLVMLERREWFCSDAAPGSVLYLTKCASEEEWAKRRPLRPASLRLIDGSK
jgi:hypothetical protein